jgi:hypothetical protein
MNDRADLATHEPRGQRVHDRLHFGQFGHETFSPARASIAYERAFTAIL